MPTRTHHSPAAKLHNLPLAAARWTDGLMGERFRRCVDVMVPTMGRLMQHDERVRFVGNFEVAAGLVEGRHRGPKWDDGDFYKWLEAAAAVFAFTHDAELDRQIDGFVELIAKTQAADGYIHTDVQIAQRAGKDVPRFGSPMDFEMYNMGHLITAACVHHYATGKTSLLAVARRAADFLAKEFAQPTPQQARHGICPAHLMALIDLARLTGEARYRDLAVTLLNMRDLVVQGDDDNQDRVPLRKESRAVGHAVRATYLYAGAADIYAETGDQTLLEPLGRIWDDLVTHKLYITGGCGALYDGASPDGAIDQTQITRIHQAFGRPWQLPHVTAHNETCAAIGNLLWNWRMFQISAEAKFADQVEWALYNSVLAGINLDGDAFFYTNPLRRLDPQPLELRWPKQRQKRLDCMCCPPNVVRTIAQSSTYAYAAAERGLYVVLYGGSTLDTPEIKLTQETRYPWDGKVRIKVERAPAGEFSLFLRIPDGPSAPPCVSTARRAPPRRRRRRFTRSGGSGRLGTRWSWNCRCRCASSKRIRMSRRRATRSPCCAGRSFTASSRPTFLLRLRVLDVHLSREIPLAARHVDDPLGGATIIEGKANATTSQAWLKQLYRDFTPAAGQTRTIDLRLIPYFAWDNRGNGEMTVWIS